MKNGFTIIELMLTVLVMSVVITLGVPAFTSSIQNNRITSQTNAMIGAISMARSEAVKLRDTRVILCSSTDQSSCSNSGDWETGWILFGDTNANGSRDNDETLIRVGQALSGGNTLRTSGFAAADRLRFDSQGALTSSGTFTFCDDRGATFARAIVTNISGQSRLAVDEGTDADIVNNHTGAAGDVVCP